MSERFVGNWSQGKVRTSGPLPLMCPHLYVQYREVWNTQVISWKFSLTVTQTVKDSMHCPPFISRKLGGEGRVVVRAKEHCARWGWAGETTERRKALLVRVWPEVDTSHMKLSRLQHTLEVGRTQVCSGDPFYSGDSGKVSSRRLGCNKGKWGFQAQKTLKLSPGTRDCRVYGKHSQPPAGFHPAASSPSANSAAITAR